jgi:DNA polymerase-3 subunit beta
MLHVKIKRDELARGAGQTKTAVDKRTTMAIIGYVMLSAEDGRDELTLKATDLVLSARRSLGAEVLEPGQVLVPAKPFFDIVRSLSGEHVILREGTGHSVTVSCGAFKTTLFGLSPDNFPEIMPLDEINFSTIEGPILADAIAKTMFATASSDETFNLKGVFFIKETEEDAKRLTLVATNTQILTMASIPLDEFETLEMEAGIIVPPAGLEELKRLGEENRLVEIGVHVGVRPDGTPDIGTLAVRTERSVVTIRLLDGTFPDYHRVLPVGHDLTAWINRRDLITVLKRIAIFQSASYSVATFSFTRDLLTITFLNPALGRAEDTVGIDYDGPTIVAGFNPQYYTEVLSAMASEKVTFLMKEDVTSYLLTGPEDPGYCAVIVTLNVSD